MEDYEQLNESTKYGDIGVTVKWIIYGKSVRERRILGWIGQKMQIDKDTADKGAGTLRRAVRRRAIARILGGRHMECACLLL